jgi:deoxyribonuclease-4
VTDRCDVTNVGFCLDTCHAHAGRRELAASSTAVKAITGRIDLVHANDSRDAFDSGATGTPTSGAGSIDPDEIVARSAAAGAPVVVETPGGLEGHTSDLDLLRERLPS